MSIYSRQYFRSIGKSLHHQFKNHQNKPGVIAVLMNTGQDTIEIEKVNCEKDLGVIIDQALDLSKHISANVSKTNRNL